MLRSRFKTSILLPSLTATLVGIAACTHAESINEQTTESHVHVRKPLPPPDEIAKLPKDGGDTYNRLVFEQSPYLLQHAANPVDWYPWGSEAFAKAKADDKPVFLSVGYSTCHWCHVMEHESFEDQEVADLMNKHFICVKVDREERPDIDKIYMDATQAMTGHGGWPMTVIMTPDKKPFFTGTYFPKNGRLGRPGMMQLVPELSRAWTDDREKVLEVADNVEKHLQQINLAPQSGSELTETTLTKAYQQLASSFDERHGGFGRAPKFPVPHNIGFLLRHHQRTGKDKALDMVVKTLTAMRHGGIYDHVGFGFHRYSTDPQWLLPHFEKMLYDQALLAIAYVDAWQVTKNPLFKQTADEIFTYVLRDMTSPEGGFYSAEDADSEGEEGKFYVWTTEEVNQVLGEESGNAFARIFNLKAGGNFTHEVGGHDSNDNIPHLQQSLVDLAADMDTTEAELAQRIETMRQKLFDVREGRIHPLKDDKILTDWNGLMIAAFARAAVAFDNAAYLEAASKAAHLLLTSLKDDKGRLYKRYRQGQAALPAHIEDYAFATWGLLELYAATYELRYLKEAIHFTDHLLAHFWDEQHGGLFLTADYSEELLVRGKEIYDGALPSGNSVAAHNLLALARLTGRTEYEEKAHAIMAAFSGKVQQGPGSFTQLMKALSFAVGPSFEVVITGKPGAKDTAAMLGAIKARYLPNAVVLFRPDNDDAEDVASIAPFSEAMHSREGKATAYVCQNFACQVPTTDVAEMLASLSGKPKNNDTK